MTATGDSARRPTPALAIAEERRALGLAGAEGERLAAAVLQET
jgi:hypothetical protein